MPEDITCNEIIAANDLKGKSNFELRGENASGESVVYKAGPLTAPLYVGTIHVDWVYSDWYTNKKPPRINLKNADETITFSGYLTEKFSSNDYDIIISFDDTTMNNCYSEIAECGLYVRSDGTMGIGNSEAL